MRVRNKDLTTCKNAQWCSQDSSTQDQDQDQDLDFQEQDLDKTHDQ